MAQDRDGREYESILEVEVSLADFAAVVLAAVLCVVMVVFAPRLGVAEHELVSLVWSWLLSLV